MNENTTNNQDAVLEYQAQRFRDLLGEMFHCCDDRMAFESKRIGLPVAEMECLLLLAGERYLTVKGLSKKMDVAKSRVTKILDNLCAKKLANRIDDPMDARVKLISLTSTGLTKSAEIDSLLKENHRYVLMELDHEDRKSVLSSLEKLRGGHGKCQTETEYRCFFRVLI
ncbi:MAG: winged helix-turn-helix transcriptional regulator [Deltaproteobacteria bacterium]|nr:winged helix-turn-helix transcriptional regulator [Deltaproteobacteria bacterium]